MSEPAQTGKTCDLRGIREAVCVHTGKITDSCLAKDCIEDLRVYLTVDSQQTLDCAASAKARYVELLFTQVQVEPVPYSSGYFTVDVTFYYRVIADATLSAGRTNTVTGLAVFSKRLVLFGGETSARIFSSRDDLTCLCKKSLQSVSLPRAIAETVDPIILGSRVMEACSCCCQNEASPAIPEALLGCFDEPLVLTGECKRLLVTIGQFSIVRLERDTQLLIPTFDYCVPSKTCPPVGGTSTESPCEVFSQIDFPMDAFFPGKNEPCIKPEDSCTGCSRTKYPTAPRLPSGSRGTAFLWKRLVGADDSVGPINVANLPQIHEKALYSAGGQSRPPLGCSHEFALGFRFSQLSAARPLRHSAADAVQTGEVFFEVAGGREGEIEGHAVALVGQAGLRQGFAEAADGQGG